MDQPLAGKKVLILIASGFEETELTEPQRALLKAGAILKTASVDTGLVNSWHGAGWGHYFTIDAPIGEILGADFDCLLLPGGERSVQKLKQSAHTRRIISHFLDGQKPMAVIGQGLELLMLAGDRLQGRVLTGPDTLKSTLQSVGSTWAEELSCQDRNVVTAQGQGAMSGFIRAMLGVFEGTFAISEAA